MAQVQERPRGDWGRTHQDIARLSTRGELQHDLHAGQGRGRRRVRGEGVQRDGNLGDQDYSAGAE